MASPPASRRDDAAASAGRGVLFIGAAKIYFMIAGAAIEFSLPNLLGKYGYGGYRLVASAVSTVNNVVVTGTIQAVSRETTANPEQADVAKATGLKMQTRLGLALALLFALASPVIAYLLKDTSKIGPLALSAGIIGGYSIYAVLVGSANGARQFHKQAGLDITFATLRAIAILGAALLGLKVYGAIGGWVAAVVAITVIAFAWVGGPHGAKAKPIRPMLVYLGGIAAYLIITNLFMTTDTFLLKRLSTSWFQAHGFADAAKEADGQVGLYGAVQQLARLPYQLMIAVTFVIFPLVSQATFENDKAKARSYIAMTLRLSLIFAGAMGAVLAAHPEPILDIPFKPEFAHAGGPALSALALGHVAFAVFSIGGTILNSAGHTRDAVISALATLVILAAALWMTLPHLEPGRQMLLGAGACTGGAMVLGSLVTGLQLRAHFGVFLPILTAVRVLLATAAAWGVCRFVPQRGPILALAGAALAAIAYIATLVITRELGREDLARVLSVAARKKA
jgi:stage V sporulation protein B